MDVTENALEEYNLHFRNQRSVACYEREITTLKQQRNDLLAALKPFGIIAEMIPKPDGSDAEWRKFNTKLNMLSLDYLRAAKAAIAKCEA